FQDGQLIEKKIKEVKTKHKTIRFIILVLICTVIFLVSTKFDLPNWMMLSTFGVIIVAGSIYTFRSLEYEDVPVTYAK
ncbi:MAG: hypothetical protein HRT43_09000, partial [Campylobacteraceae bacterium]|nr:hypothetical protein [Campylobacteraceae bacterium]